MAQPVVHFEIIGSQPASLRRFYGQLFGWEFDTSGRTSEAISEPDNYGFIAPHSPSTGNGVAGGVGGGEGYESRVIFYVEVPDVEEALQQAERLGATRLLGPERAPEGPLVVGHFSDPEGNRVGVASVTGT